MTDDRIPHPKNAPGPFYVENGCCITCMVPHVHAPAMMGFDDSGGHCFVKQQPRTEDEIYRAIRAVSSSEVECLRYRGRDPDIQRRLVEIGMADICDHPLPTNAVPVLREHVTFKSALADEAWIAIAFKEYLLGENSEHERYKVTHPKRHGRVVTIGFSWYKDNYHELQIGPGESLTDRWLISHSETWEVASVGVSLMIDDWLRSDPRFSDFRWYTSNAWNTGINDWQERPY